MTHRSTRALVSASVLVLTCATAGLALAGPLKGRTYQGTVPSKGTDREGHRIKTHATGSVVLRVAGSGRSVTVRFSSAAPVLYCVTREQIHAQTTKPARISASGRFTARIDERFAVGPGAPS